MAERRKLGELLIEAGLLDESQLSTALSDQTQWGRPLGVTLVKLGFVDEADMLRVLSQQLNSSVIDLEGKRVAPEVLELLPCEIARRQHCLPLVVQRKGPVEELYLGISDPTDLEVTDDISFRTGLKVRPVLVGDRQLEEAIEVNYRRPDTHQYLRPITPDDIEDPGAAAPASSSRPVTPKEPAPILPCNEPQLRLDGDEARAPAESAPPSPQASDADVLRALIQLLIAQGTIDADELIERIQSMAEDPD